MGLKWPRLGDLNEWEMTDFRTHLSPLVLFFFSFRQLNWINQRRKVKREVQEEEQV